MTNSKNNSSNGSGTQVPAIRTFQFNEGGSGHLKDSVNLFRGDVNYHLPLLTLPGRAKHDGLTAKVSMLYQSNVHEEATRRNVEAPTGPLGLGWSMPLETIYMSDPDSVSPNTRTWYLESNGTRNTLKEEPQPLRFPMDASLKSDLPDSSSTLSWSALNSDIISRFVSNHVPLSSDTGKLFAAAVPNVDNCWRIKDDGLQQQFTIQLEGTGTNLALNVYDGGNSFQLQNYKYWKVLYYPLYERWLIVKENGISFSYGGAEKPGQAGAGIQWGVRWGTTAADGQETAIWTGNSSNISKPTASAMGQQYYARAWHLVEVSDPWGDAVTYSYNETGSATGITEADISQSVGTNDGLAYTKAFYLTGITDIFKRKAIFNYQNKLYSSGDTAAREYDDPHKQLTANSTSPSTAPSNLNSPNGFQDRYETKYLDSVIVNDETGSRMFSFQMDYIGSDGVTNINSSTTYTGKLYGNTFKRFLTGVTKKNADGNSLPGITFAYYTTPGDTTSGANPGAIKSITTPGGATATYNYTSQNLDCKPQICIAPPSEAKMVDPLPRYWFGEDYVVSIWYDPTNTKQVTLKLYTWVGQWLSWTPTPDSVIYNSTTLQFDPTTFAVETGNDFCVFYFSNLSDNTPQTYAWLFRKDPAKAGQWIPVDDNTGSSCSSLTVESSPSSYIVFDGTWKEDNKIIMNFVTGDQFLAVYNSSIQSDNLTRFTYQWLNREWSCRTDTLTEHQSAGINITGHNEYLFILNRNGESAAVSLDYLDPLGNWQSAPGGSVSLNPIPLSPSDTYGIPLALAAGDTFVALSWGETQQGFLLYSGGIVQWDENYNLLSWSNTGGESGYLYQPPPSPQAESGYTFKSQVQNSPGDSLPPSIAPKVSGNSLVAWAGNAVRFNGQKWMLSTTLMSGTDNDFDPYVQRYAYADDVVVQSYYDTDDAWVAQVLSFDPDSNTFATAKLPSVDPPGSTDFSSNWPFTSGENGLSVGSYLYLRQPGTSNWATALGNDDTYTVSDLGTIESPLILNQAPDFACYMSSSSAADFVLIRNGEVGTATALKGPLNDSDLKYLVPTENTSTHIYDYTPGTYPAGPSSIVSFLSDYETGSSTAYFYLQRYVRDTLTESITHFAVQSLVITNGASGSNVLEQSCYQYTESNANCDPTGRVAKFYETTVYPGYAALPGTGVTPAYGKKINHYYNGVSWEPLLSISSPPADTTATCTNIPSIVYNTTPDIPDQMLDGHLIRTDIYSNENNSVPAASTVSQWSVYRARRQYAPTLANPINTETLNLYGGFAVKTSATHTKDGVTTTTSMKYSSETGIASPSGQEIQSTHSAQVLAFDETPSSPIQNITETRTGTITYPYDADSDIGALFRSRHMLKNKAQKKVDVTRGADNWILSASASAFTSCPSQSGYNVPAGESHYTYTGTAAAGGFVDFNPDDPGPDWLLHSKVIKRSLYGQPQQSMNAEQVNASSIYDRDWQFPLAHFANAALSQCAYLGFESYELGSDNKAPNSNWTYTLESGVAPVQGRAHMGLQSLNIPNTKSQSFTFAIENANLGNDDSFYYMVGFCYKTAPGFKAVPEGMTVDVKVTTGTAPTVPALAFEDTGGQWNYCSRAFLLKKDAGQVTITVTAANSGGQNLWLDDLHCNPLVCKFSAHSYDPVFRYAVDSMGTGGQTTRVMRDRFHRKVSHTEPGLSLPLIPAGHDDSPTGQVPELSEIKSVTQSYISRQSGSGFQTDNPNAAVMINPEGSGFCDTFRDDIWMQHWGVSEGSVTFADSSSSCGSASTPWCVSNGMLVQAENTSQELSLAAAYRHSGSDGIESWALAFEVIPMSKNGSTLTPATGLSASLTVTFGSNTISWDPGAADNKNWLYDNSNSTALAAPPAMGRNWLLAAGEPKDDRQPIFFFADGQLIFSETISEVEAQAAQKTLKISTGDNYLALRNLGYMESIRTTVNFLDAFHRHTQSQHLHDGNAWVDQTVTDFMGNKVAQTKAAPASFTGHDNPGKLLQPLPVSGSSAFIDLEGFTGTAADPGSGTMNTTGIMSGTIADYYSGKEQEGVSIANDNGFPYSRKVFEASPLKRLIESGMPGQDHAYIANTHNPAQRPTTKHRYTNLKALLGEHAVEGIAVPTEAAFFAKISSVPTTKITSGPNEGQYHFTVSAAIKDQFGEKAGSIVYGDGSQTQNPVVQSYTLRTYTDQGIKQISVLPNHFNHNTKYSDADYFCVTTQYDMRHHPISRTGPDTDGNSQSMYDNLGRVRFTKLPGSASPVVYFKHDALGRVVESGTFTTGSTITWSDLTQYVNDRSWPGSKVYPDPSGGTLPTDLTVVKYYFYDNLGSDLSSPPALLGNDPTQTGKLTKAVNINRRTLYKTADYNTTVTVSKSYQYFHNSHLKQDTLNIQQEDEGKSAITLKNAAVGYEYYPDGKVSSIQYPDLAAVQKTYAFYNDLDQPIDLCMADSSLAMSSVASYVYNPEGLVSETREAASGKSLKVSHTYNSMGHLTESNFDAADAKLTYHLTTGGRIDNMSYSDNDDNHFTGNYDYDPLQRLETCTATPSDMGTMVKCSKTSDNSAYDLNGNIGCLIRDPDGSAVDTTFTATTGTDQIQYVNSESLPVVYDDPGRITSAPQHISENGGGKNTNVVSYDPCLGLTSQVDVNDGSTLKNRSVMVYDHLGQRVLKYICTPNVDPFPLIYVHGHSAMPLVEYVGGSTVNTYIYGPKGMIRFYNNSDYYLPVRDEEGTVRSVLGSGLDIKAYYQYYPFGALKNPVPSFTPLRYLYTGQEYDLELGLYNYRARMYDPWLCRFYAPDPKHQYASPYVYVGGDPMGKTDPTGKQSGWGKFLGGLEAFAGGLMTLGTGGFLAPIGIPLALTGGAGIRYSESDKYHSCGFWRDQVIMIGATLAIDGTLAIDTAIGIATDGAGTPFIETGMGMLASAFNSAFQGAADSMFTNTFKQVMGEPDSFDGTELGIMVGSGALSGFITGGASPIMSKLFSKVFGETVASGLGTVLGGTLGDIGGGELAYNKTMEHEGEESSKDAQGEYVGFQVLAGVVSSTISFGMGKTFGSVLSQHHQISKAQGNAMNGIFGHYLAISANGGLIEGFNHFKTKKEE